MVLQAGITDDDYTYVDGIVNINNVVDNIEIKGFSIEEDFDHTGGEQSYTISYPGVYKLETWGAQGTCWLKETIPDQHCGYGGYSSGLIKLTFDKLYINVGGSGYYGGYNGGGYADGGAGGGGATHIATISGELSLLEEYKDSNEILIVSGGGGGADIYGGGSGGGYKGCTASGDEGHVPGEGGTQSEGGSGTNNGSFGKGANNGNIINDNGVDGSGSGGGGWYGGGSGKTPGWSSGGGGSGYIGNPLLTNKYMICYECETSDDESTKTLTTTNVSTSAKSDYAKSGNGYAKITLLKMIKE